MLGENHCVPHVETNRVCKQLENIFEFEVETKHRKMNLMKGITFKLREIFRCFHLTWWFVSWEMYFMISSHRRNESVVFSCRLLLYLSQWNWVMFLANVIFSMETEESNNKNEFEADVWNSSVRMWSDQSVC